MYLDSKIFNEIQYYSADDSYTISNDCGVFKGYSNYEIIEQLIRDDNPIDPTDNEEDYEDFIQDEMESYPMLGYIPWNSVLHDAMGPYQRRCGLTLVNELSPDIFDASGYYFLTRDTNYDVIDVDLFIGDGSGQAKDKFIDFINSKEFEKYRF